MPERLYAAVQSLLDRGDEITREEIDDLAVWATQVFHVEMLPRLRDREEVGALELVRTMCLDTFGVHARHQSRAVTKLITHERARAALAIRLDSCAVTPETIRKIVSAPFERLRVLGLTACRIKIDQLAALCEAEVLGGVESLDLSCNVLREEGAQLLGAATAFPRLRALDLRYTRMTPAAIIELGRTAPMEHVRTLALGTDKLGATFGERLVNSGVFPDLQRLSIYKAQLGSTGATALARRSGLRVLHVMENDIGNAGVVAIAESPAMHELAELRFRHDRVGNDALIAIAKSPYMAALKRLQISQCLVGHAGLAALARSPHVRLDYLNIGTSRGLGGEAITFLASAPFAGVRELVLDGIDLGDDGMASLVKVTTWPRLERLSVQANGLTDHAIDALLRWPQLRQLRSLELGTNDITDDGLARLVNAEGLRLERIELWQAPCAENANAIVEASPLRGITIDTNLTWRDYPEWVD